MRFKDFVSPFYVFGEWPDGGRCDVAYRQDDVVTAVEREEALRLIRLVDNFQEMLWFFWENADKATRDAAYDRLNELNHK